MKIQTLGTPTGSLGPVVTYRGRAGTVQRNRVIPLNPQTARQQNQRATLSLVSSQWRALDNSKQMAWEAFAEQLPGKPTGAQAYVKINCNRILGGMAVTQVPPELASFAVLALSGFRCMIVGGTDLTLGWQTTPTPNPAPDRYVVYAHRPTSAGRGYFGDFRWITTCQAITGLQNFGGAYTSKFGMPGLGTKVAVKVVQIKDGQKSIPIFEAAICVED